MTQKQQLLAILESSGTGYGLDEDTQAGEVVQIESTEQYPEGNEFFVTSFVFDNSGKLVEVTTSPGEHG
jgi:hypothetical protein